MDAIQVNNYISSNGILYHLYGFDDKIVVCLFGIPQMLCDITDNYAELIESHERDTYGTDGGNESAGEVGAD